MTLTNVGQAPHSLDCGYFAGYAALLRERYGNSVETAPVTEEDVYRARNKYLGEPNASLEPRFESSLSNTAMMAGYLATIGCHGYKAEFYGRSPKVTNEEHLRMLLRRHTSFPNQRSAFLLAIGRREEGHWITIMTRSRDPDAIQRPQLNWGTKGESTRFLQRVLNLAPGSRLAKLGEDADFGNKTYARVREFQDHADIKVDGIAGDQTWDELEPVINKHFPERAQKESRYVFYNPLLKHDRLVVFHESQLVNELAGGVWSYVWRTEH